MAFATLKLYKCTGTNAATETYVSDSIVAFLNADIHSVDVGSYAIGVPAGVADPANYSYETWLRWTLDNEPDNYIQNIKVYGSSSQPDSPNNKLTVMMGATETAATPVDTASTVATTAQHSNYYDATTNNLAITVVPADNKLDTTGEQTFYCVSQLKVEYGAQQSQVGTMTFNMTYEEV